MEQSLILQPSDCIKISNRVHTKHAFKTAKILCCLDVPSVIKVNDKFHDFWQMAKYI